jgi:hypothetical protein
MKRNSIIESEENEEKMKRNSIIESEENEEENCKELNQE